MNLSIVKTLAVQPLGPLRLNHFEIEWSQFSVNTHDHALAELRQQIVHLKIILGVMFLICVCGPLLGWFTARPASAANKPTRIVARDFTLVDDSGRECARLRLNETGQPCLEIYGEKGSRIELGSYINKSGSGFGLSLQEANSKAILKLGLSSNTEQFKNSNSIGLFISSNQKQHIDLSLDPEAGMPYLALGNAAKSLVDLGIWAIDQRPYLKLTRDGKCRASLYLPPKRPAKLEILKESDPDFQW